MKKDYARILFFAYTLGKLFTILKGGKDFFKEMTAKFIMFLWVMFVFIHSTGAFAQCNTTNATSCRCQDSTQTDCDLLPDLEIAQAPFYQSGEFGVIEYSQTGNTDTTNNGKLRITLAVPNIGHGPLEVWATDTFVCGIDTFYGTPPSICPDSITYPKIITKQRIYHKTGNGMSYWERTAGSMSYHPSVNHMCIDNWGVFSLRTDNGDTNPLNWPVIGSGSKIAMCLTDYTNCPDTNYPGYCLDTTGKILNHVSDFPNYGLAGNSNPYYCSPVFEGISSGSVDVYWAYSPDQYVAIPPGLCNGNYYIVTQVDANNYFLEENKNNNIYVAPVTLSLQTNCSTLVPAYNSLHSFNIYPNPVGNQLTVSGLRFEVQTTLEIYNIIGEKVYSKQLETSYQQSETTVDISILVSGIYLVQLIEGNASYYAKMIKK